MAKARMLSVAVCEDEKLHRCSLEAAFAYVCTIPHLDRDGLVSGKASWLAGHVLTERPELHTRMGAFVDEWVTQGLVTRYPGSNGPVLFFHGFRKHNANLPYDKEQRSEFPPPPGYHRDPEGKIGLIPDDPEVAGRLAEAFDKRSLYRIALTEAAKKREMLAESLGLTDSHNEVVTYSRPGRDEVVTNRSRTEVEDQQNGSETEKNNNSAALRELVMAEAETAVVVVGIAQLLAGMNDEQTMALLSWLWLYNNWNQDDWAYRDHFRRNYSHDPFAGMNSPGAVMVARAKARAPAPLHADDRAEMMVLLRQAGEAQP